MQRAASYQSLPEQPRTLAIAGSLLLVSLSYVLLLAAPVISRNFGAFALGNAGLKTLESWLPLACGAGLVLGGASALVFVLTQITREAQRRPYVSLAPVLAAFSACVLIGLRAELPLPGVSAEHVAVFAVAVAVVGGSLVQTPRVSAQLLGMACTFLPPASLFGVLWVLSGSSDPARAIWGLPSTTRAFLGMLTLSSFAIGAVATLGRRAETASEAVPSVRLPVPSRDAVLPARETARFDSSEDLEQSLLADEALLRRRGLPGWLIALLAVAALVLSFMALKLYMDRRAAVAFLERASESSLPMAPVASQPAAAPEVSGVAVEPSVEPARVEPEAASTSVLTVPTVAIRAGAPAPMPVAPGTPQPARAGTQAESAASPSAGGLVTAPSDEHHAAHGSRSHARAAHGAQHTPKARKTAPEARVEARAQRTEAKPAAVEPKPVQEAKPAARAEPKPAPAPAARGDESLDELMDNVLKPAKGGAKKRDVSEDPIYGL